jgi:hypothetical protein
MRQFIATLSTLFLMGLVSQDPPRKWRRSLRHGAKRSKTEL